MHEYDITLKSVLRRLTGSVLLELTGFRVTRWHNVELPEVRSGRADMLGETADGTLVHIELQSTNESGMALRMLEYATAICSQFGRFPEQVVLYVGRAPLRMRDRIAGPKLEFTCKIMDIRELDAEPLIASNVLEDNVVAVLAKLKNQGDAVRRILLRIGVSEPERRALALKELIQLAALRELEPIIRREAKQMPILDDIMDNKVLGPERRKGIEIGREEGLEQGRQEGERKIVLRQIAKRFGPVPAAARKRIDALSASKLERIALRLLDAGSLDELLD